MHGDRSLFRALVLAALIGSAVGDAAAQDSQPPLLTALPRALSSDERAIVNANNAFAFRLFRQVATSDANHLISPLSASFALGMAANGADGATLDGIKTALSLDGLSVAEANAGYRALTTLLTSLDQTTEIRIANSAWFNRRFTPAAPFLASVQDAFSAKVERLDFRAASSPERINSWVNEATRGRIPRIVGSLQDDLALFLANALFFKGSWRDQFDPELTKPEPFHGTAGPTTVAMMQMREDARFGRSDSHLMLDLPYGNGAYAMTLVMPARADVPLPSLIDSLTPQRWSAWTSSLHYALVSVQLPRFTLDYSRRLNEDLSALGMQRAFSTQAEFPFILQRPLPLAISEALQITRLEVNETGTVAAAATGLSIVVTSAPTVVEFHANRPFILVLRERLTGTILFIGKVVKL